MSSLSTTEIAAWRAQGDARFARAAPEVDVLLFDLDDTLVEIRSRYFQLELTFMLRALPRFMRTVPPWRFRRAFWTGVRAMRGNATASSNYEVFVDAMSRAAQLPHERVEQMLEETIARDLPALERHFAPVRGARATLLEATELGYRVILATNPMWPAKAAQYRLKWAGLADIEFEWVTHSQNSSRCKPHVGYYEQLLGVVDVHPSRCVMIGNDPINDVRATEVGIDTFLIQRSDGPRIAESPRYGRGSFEDLRKFLRASAEARREGVRSRLAPGPAVEPEHGRSGEISSRVESPLPQREGKSMQPKIICVTGPDGSGKTTQIARLASWFDANREEKGVAVTIWDLLLDPSCRGRVPFESPRAVDAYLGILDPTSRALFLYHCFHEAMVLAKKRKASVLLVNSYWYKYYATEIAHGGDPQLLRQLAAAIFPKPDITFYLRLEPKDAVSRKDVLSGYETGFDKHRSKEAFLEFQAKALPVLDGLANELGWIELDGLQSIENLTSAMVDRLGQELAAC